MHRHGYKGKKFGREQGPRKALLRSLAESLVRDGSITTTKPKAKELVPYVEKLITKAKKADLASRRKILEHISVNSSHKLVDEIAPKLTARSSGHLRVKAAGYRRGDNAVMASVSFVDDIKSSHKTASKAKTKSTPTKKEDDQEADQKQTTTRPTKDDTSQPHGVAEKLAPKRTGVRGNR